MAFTEHTKTHRIIKNGRISLTDSYLNLGDQAVPWERVRIQYDTEANQLRLVEGGENDFPLRTSTKLKGKHLYCRPFVRRGFLPQGIYRLIDETPDSLTYQFEQPPLRWRKTNGR